VGEDKNGLPSRLGDTKSFILVSYFWTECDGRSLCICREPCIYPAERPVPNNRNLFKVHVIDPIAPVCVLATPCGQLRTALDSFDPSRADLGKGTPVSVYCHRAAQIFLTSIPANLQRQEVQSSRHIAQDKPSNSESPGIPKLC
jgi:hypothetical protein